MNAVIGWIFILLKISCNYVQGDNIVFFMGFGSYSQRIALWPMADSLAERGHNVTFISPFENKKPNPKVHEMIPQSLIAVFNSWSDHVPLIEGRKKSTAHLDWFSYSEMGETVCETLLSEPEVLQWIENTHVDMFVIDFLFNECAYAIAHKKNAKTVLFNANSICPWHSDIYGIPVESSWIPDVVFHFQQNMTFMEKVYSTLNPVFWNFQRQWQHIPRLEAIIKDKLNMEINLLELESKNNLMLLNAHFSEDYARSLPPMVVSVGGLQCTDNTEPLPKDMEEFVNKTGSKGFIYISFGSCIQISTAPEEIKNAFFGALRKFKDIQFIWTWEGEFPQVTLPNVKFVKWAPQNDILAHPKIKAFMTHSGMLSTQESIYYGVPLITMPVFADQDYNAEKIHRKQIGIRLEVLEVTEDILESAIRNIIENPVYETNMKLTSKRYRDRPMTALDTAVWWLEYVLRHEDTSSLSPLSRYQTWYQRRLLDVWAFVLIILILLISSGLHICITVIRLLFNIASNKTGSTKSATAQNKIKRN